MTTRVRYLIGTSAVCCLLASGNMNGQTLIPERVLQLALGSALADVQREFPNAKLLAEDKATHKALLLSELPSDTLWDSVMFELLNQSVVSISLMHGVAARSDTESKGQMIIAAALKDYGPAFEKRLARTSEKQLEPVFMWKRDRSQIFLAIDSHLSTSSDINERIRLVITSQTREMREMFELPTPAQIESSTFDLLMKDVPSSGGVR